MQQISSASSAASLPLHAASKHLSANFDASVRSDVSVSGISCHGASILSGASSANDSSSAYTHHCSSQHLLLSSMLQSTGPLVGSGVHNPSSATSSLLQFRMPVAVDGIAALNEAHQQPLVSPQAAVSMFETDDECRSLWICHCIDDLLVPSSSALCNRRPPNAHTKNFQ